jgi:uroporphyrin-III C-methyltransferase/precorrin-2 dehydrogenase/sirohydrochlorin ferrochelatase
MQHFPIFVALAGRRVVLSGGAEAALAKLRLLLKTEAHLTVFAINPDPQIVAWHDEGRVRLIRRRMEPGDTLCAVLFYAANEDAAEDARTQDIARADGALTNVVDNLGDSQFITPAIVDRDPVTVAIGTEGAAPVLARAIKADLEARLPSTLGPLARIGKAFRRAAEALPMGRPRRDFWAAYYFDAGPRAIAQGEDGARKALDGLFDRYLARSTDARGSVAFVGAGPGDPELLTLKARKALDTADVVIHDRLVGPAILELARREALMIDVGKTGFGPSTRQQDIDALIVEHAAQGARVVRLKGGDPAIFARLDEEVSALEAADIDWHVIPGITAASASAAAIGQSLTRRGRNDDVRFMTGHDVKGLAEHDWRAIARRGEVTALYMGKRAARFVQGRLLMHGAASDTPVTIVENASLPSQRVVEATIGSLPDRIADADLTGPALMLLGMAPRTRNRPAYPQSQPAEQEAL